MVGVRTRTRFRHLVVALLLVSLATGVRAAESIWPIVAWRTSTPEEQGMRSDVLADMLERIRWNEYRIHSVSIVRNGHLVMDAYLHSRWKGRRHASYSVTKSVMSALVGLF